MHSLLLYLGLLRYLAGAFTRIDAPYALSYAFLHYAFRRARRIASRNLARVTVREKALGRFAGNWSERRGVYVDRASCALVSETCLPPSSSAPCWAYVCSLGTRRKCRIALLPLDNAAEDTLYLSSGTRHNLENGLRSWEPTDVWFLLPVGEAEVPSFAAEARISAISKPRQTANRRADLLLEAYFSEPRFLRPGDVFCPRAEDVAEGRRSALSPEPIYFKVRGMKARDKDGAFVLRGETSLMQEGSVSGYLPRKPDLEPRSLGDRGDRGDGGECARAAWPEYLAGALRRLESCVRPFLKRGLPSRLKPLLLLEGPRGCGKRRLVRICCERSGLHLLEADFAEAQSPTSAQTEANLRVLFRKASASAPCVLYLTNLQTFGRNSDGQRDERVLSSLATEMREALPDKPLEYPVIVIASSDGSEVFPELRRLFVERISLDRLDQAYRTELISWVLAERGLESTAPRKELAGLCADFRPVDFTTLALHAAKAAYGAAGEAAGGAARRSASLTEEHLRAAHEYVRRKIHLDARDDGPRVPKVHWEDIGGLAELKEEIVRRAKLPLLGALGFGQSGVLLYGPPGTGKTLLAKALATEYQLRFISVKGPEVLNMYVGQSEKNVRQVFERAREAAPCIMFFDELDALAPSRGGSGDSAGVMDRVVSQLLAEMDGLEGTRDVLIVGATNRPDLVEPALLRPGRFDKMLYVGVHSDRSARVNVLKALTRNFRLREGGRELQSLADDLPAECLTGADLYAVCSDAWLAAARHLIANRTAALADGVVVELRDFLEAARRFIPSVAPEELGRYARMRDKFSPGNTEIAQRAL
ncbi:hypothetical protein KM043_000470 [Ampulex compressa]|nr:hypothetical protein KM043_000470 [Ampulex compressa]